MFIHKFSLLFNDRFYSYDDMAAIALAIPLISAGISAIKKLFGGKRPNTQQKQTFLKQLNQFETKKRARLTTKSHRKKKQKKGSKIGRISTVYKKSLVKRKKKVSHNKKR